MLRTSRVSLKAGNRDKKQKLVAVFTEYHRCLSFFVGRLLELPSVSFKYLPKELERCLETWLSARMIQCLGKHALQIAKAFKSKKQKKDRPVVPFGVLELDQRFVSILWDAVESFDGLMKVGSIGNKIKLALPFKKHRQTNQLLAEGFILKKSVRLILLSDGQPYADLFFEKPFERSEAKETIGLDTGIKKLIVSSSGLMLGKELETKLEKIGRKKHGSKAWRRALKERDAYIGEVIKKLPESTDFVVEALSSMHKNTKKRMRKQFRKKLHRWTYRKMLSQVYNLANRRGSFVFEVDPAYTSQTCSQCGSVHRENRNGELFKCRKCGYTADADLNASLNILDRFLLPEYGRQKSESTA